MTGPGYPLRLPSLVLAAIVGMLSAAGEASACSALRAGKPISGCCARRAQSACCCQAKTVKSRPESSRHTLGGIGSSAEEAACVCRPGAPADPAPKPRSPSDERRTPQDRTGSVEPTNELYLAIAFVRLVPPTESPPGAPLYLRTSHLLF